MTDTIDTKNHPAVKALAAHQERLGITGVRFARRYLRCSDATWSTLKGGTYPSKNVEPWIEKIEAALRMIEDEALVVGGERPTLLELTDGRAAINAVRRCANEPRNRLVAYLADTGGGKSKLAEKLADKLGETVVRIEATETWRDNYFAALLAVAEALGLTDGIATARACETTVIDHLAASPRILVIDEAHYAGRAALNLIKLVLNQTMSRVLMLAMPQLWDRMQRKNWEEAQQLRNRTYAKIVLRAVTADDCRTFLTSKMEGYAALKADEKQAVALCRDAANRFGLFNTLDAICGEAAQESAGGALTLDMIRQAISRVEALRS